MYVMIGKHYERPVEVAEDQHGEPVMHVRDDVTIRQLADAVNASHLRKVLTTTFAARRAHLRTGYTYTEAARTLSCSARFLSDLVASDPTVPHFKVSKSVRFSGADLEEIHARFQRGEYRYHPRPGRARDGES